MSCLSNRTAFAFIDMPVSGTNWFHAFELKRKQDYSVWSKARQVLAEDWIRQRAQQG